MAVYEAVIKEERRGGEQKRFCPVKAAHFMFFSTLLIISRVRDDVRDGVKLLVL